MFYTCYNCGHRRICSLEDEITYMDILATAQAVHNNGGLVILQAKRVVKAGSIHPKK